MEDCGRLHSWPLFPRGLREEHTLRVFKHRVMRRILKPKGDEVRGWWKKLHNEELHDIVPFAKYNWNCRGG
jgi:hypothetical protein